MIALGNYRDYYFPNTEPLAADEMRVIALGTGRPFVRRAQASTSWLVELGNGDKFVFDFGSGSQTNFTALEIHIRTSPPTSRRAPAHRPRRRFPWSLDRQLDRRPG